MMVACEQVEEGGSKRRYLEEDFMDPNQLLCLGALFNIAATNVSADTRVTLRQGTYPYECEHNNVYTFPFNTTYIISVSSPQLSPLMYRDLIWDGAFALLATADLLKC